MRQFSSNSLSLYDAIFVETLTFLVGLTVNLALDYNQLIGTVPAQMVQLPNLGEYRHARSSLFCE